MDSEMSVLDLNIPHLNGAGRDADSCLGGER